MTMGSCEIVSRVLGGDIRAVSRLISVIEDRRPGYEQAYAEIYPATGRAHIIGITGPPGSGKSTLVDKMASAYRGLEKKVAVVAVDPSSPFTGGAILGDRVRMQRHTLDPGVFIRSMGARGQLGGVSFATSGAVDVLDAAGFDYVIIETVGVGQSEVEIASLADTVVLVQVPGLGDDIQIIKAGVMEIGDVFVVNKKDRPGADRVVAEIRMAMEMGQLGQTQELPTAQLYPGGHAGGHVAGAGHVAMQSGAVSSSGEDRSSWRPPLLQTMAESGEGVDDLCTECDRHRLYLEESGQLSARRYRRARSETMRLASERIWNELARNPGSLSAAENLAWQVARREQDPYSASAELFNMLVGRARS